MICGSIANSNGVAGINKRPSTHRPPSSWQRPGPMNWQRRPPRPGRGTLRYTRPGSREHGTAPVSVAGVAASPPAPTPRSTNGTLRYLVDNVADAGAPSSAQGDARRRTHRRDELRTGRPRPSRWPARMIGEELPTTTSRPSSTTPPEDAGTAIKRAVARRKDLTWSRWHRTPGTSKCSIGVQRPQAAPRTCPTLTMGPPPRGASTARACRSALFLRSSKPAGAYWRSPRTSPALAWRSSAENSTRDIDAGVFWRQGLGDRAIGGYPRTARRLQGGWVRDRQAPGRTTATTLFDGVGEAPGARSMVDAQLPRPAAALAAELTTV